MTGHLLLIDASGFAHRAFHAFPNSWRSDGLPTGAIIGFMSIIWRMIGAAEADKPTHAVAIFDHASKTFRHRLYPQYKANRDASRAKQMELAEQLPLMREGARILGLGVAEFKGYEADDVIATLARRAAAIGMRSSIVSSDKDFCQLVKDDVCEIVDPLSKKRILEADVRDPKKFGVAPEQVPDVQALCGDTVDNIPGVPHIGLLKAAGLIRRFGSLDALLKDLDKGHGFMTTPAVRAALKRERKNIPLYRKLATLKTNVPIKFEWSDFEVKPVVRAHLVEIMKALEALPKLDLIFGGGPTYLQRPAQPTADPYAWWRRELHRPGQKIPEAPQAGWYQRRLVKGGVWVPARIYRMPEVDFVTEQPTGRDVVLCDVGGERRDPLDEWSKLCTQPIKEETFKFLMAKADYAKKYSPTDPEASPTTPTNWDTCPL